MNSGIDRMILCTSIGGVLHSVEFYVSEVADYFDLLDLPVLLHDLRNELFVHLLQSADEQLADQNALVDFLARVCLIFYLLLPTQRHAP